MNEKKRINLVLQKLSVEGKKKFYTEYCRQLASGKSREVAISEAFKKFGMDLWRLDLKDSIDITYKKQGG